MDETIETRTKMLLGEEAVETLKDKTVAVFGLGGVGGTAFEALVRTGIGHIYAIDRDVVSESNLNRQLLFTRDQVGAQKALCAFIRSKLIREDVAVLPENFSVSLEELEKRDYTKCDLLLDCIDDIKAKVDLMKYSLKHNIPLVICCGMGNRIEPNKLKIVSLKKTEGDPLAKSLRGAARREGLPLDAFMCVISEEDPMVKFPKPSSIMPVPSAAGLMMASYAIKTLAKI